MARKRTTTREPDALLVEWGQRIARTRNLRNRGGEIRRNKLEPAMTQGDLATAVGVEQGTVSRWEGGWLEPRREKKAQIAAVLGVDPEHLFPIPQRDVA